jgi:hypothetical protein
MFKFIWKVVISCLIVGFLTFQITKSSIKPKIEYIKTLTQQPNQNICNDDSVWNYLKILKIKYPKIVLAQAKLESNNYNSPLFIKNNNLFGMTEAESRPTTSIHKKREKYAYYKTYYASIEDYAIWQSSILHKIKNEKQYMIYIGKYYASDPKYSSKIKKITDTL